MSHPQNLPNPLSVQIHKTCQMAMACNKYGDHPMYNNMAQCEQQITSSVNEKMKAGATYQDALQVMSCYGKSYDAYGNNPTLNQCKAVGKGCPR
jgi:hypothetical protein